MMSGDLKAQLEISADASGVEAGVNKAKRSLKDLGASASAHAKEASDSLASIGDGGKQASQKVDSSTKNMIGAIQRQIAVMEAGSRSGSEYYKVLANQRGIDTAALKPYLDQLDAVAAKQKLATQAVNAASPTYEQAGLSAKAMAAALRGVPAQFTDIAVSLQGGQAPLTVFLQQGGQLKDMFGGIGPAAKALGGYLYGLVNPLTVVAAAAAVLGTAYYQGSKEADEYAKAIILTGGAAGKTVGQLQAMARSIEEVSGTESAAAAAITQFASASYIAGDNIERFTAISLKMERLVGQAVKETVKEFSELGKSPVEASIRLNETTNYLTASIYQQIKALDDQGKSAEASALAQKTYADAMESRLKQVENNLGLIERAWAGVGSVAKSAWDAMLDIGRQQSMADQAKAITNQINAIDERKSANPQTAAFRAQLVARLGVLQVAEQQSRIDAEQQKAIVDQTNARIRFDKDGAQFLSNQVKMQREIAKARNEGLAAGAKQVEIDKRIADITEKYKDKGSISTGLQIDKSKLGADLSAIKKANEQLTGSYGNAERIMEAQRAAGLLSESDYYESKRAFIRLTAEAQEDALRKEIDRFKQEQLSGKDKIENAKKIAEAESAIAKLRADGIAKQEVLSNQQEAAAGRLQLSFRIARQAAEDYFDTLDRQQQRTLNSLGMGQLQRDRNSGVAQIEDRYSGQRRDLENQRSQLEFEGKFKEAEKIQYQNRLAMIIEFQDKSIQSYNRYYDNLIKRQADWSVGASESLQNYMSQSRNIAQGVEQAFTNAFKGMEDALVDFVMTGKLSFSDLARSIIADIVRIQAKQAIAGLTGLLSSFFPGGAGAGMSNPGAGANGFVNWSSSNPLLGGRAIGGPVSANSMYRVNEKGTPEIANIAGHQYLLTGRQGGVVEPVSSSGVGGVNVSVHVDASGTKAEGDSQLSAALGRQIGAVVQAVLQKEKRPGGILS